jgi:prepilin-type processing-associated H-X9-DG protein
MRRFSDAALSILEVLCVVAVVGVLAALLAPTMRAVSESSHVAGCLNNLRQLGVAFQSYANDHDGYLPRTETPRPDGLSGTVVWPHHVCDYLGVNYSAIQGAAKAALARRTPFVCPAEKEPAQPWHTYAINRQLREVGGAGAKAYIKQAAIKSPSKYVVLSDAYKSHHQYNDRAQKMRDWNFMDRRHGGKPNFLYADWHVAPFTEKIIGEMDPGGNSPFYKSLWMYEY